MNITTLYNVKLYNNTTDELDVNFVLDTKEKADELFNHIDAKIAGAYGRRYNVYYNLFIDKIYVVDDADFAKHMVDESLQFEIGDENV